MTDKLKKQLILNLPYLVFVYLFDKLCQGVRLAPGADASEKLLHIGQGFSAAFASLAPSFHLLDLCVGAAGAVLIRLAVYSKGKNAKKYRRGIEYGSARWGTPADIAPYVDKDFSQNVLLTPDDRETGETVRTPRGAFHVTDMSREQMEAAGYGFHHESEDGKYLIMANGSRAFAIPSGDAPEHTAPEKLTVLVVEPMKEPYVKEIDPGLHALQAEVGGDIAASYPFDDPVGLVLNDEGKLIGLDLNRSLWDEHGEIYDIVAGTFLVVGLGEESFTSLPPELAQKYMEHFKQPEQFINLNGQIVALPVEPENPLRTAEMTLEDDYGMIDGIINNGRRGEELEKAQDEARRTTPEKKPSIRERLEDAKRECGERKPPDKAHQKKPPEHDL